MEFIKHVEIICVERELEGEGEGGGEGEGVGKRSNR
jgi:hypothetical protein